MSQAQGQQFAQNPVQVSVQSSTPPPEGQQSLKQNQDKEIEKKRKAACRNSKNHRLKRKVEAEIQTKEVAKLKQQLAEVQNALTATQHTNEQLTRECRASERHINDVHQLVCIRAFMSLPPCIQQYTNAQRFAHSGIISQPDFAPPQVPGQIAGPNLMFQPATVSTELQNDMNTYPSAPQQYQPFQTPFTGYQHEPTITQNFMSSQFNVQWGNIPFSDPMEVPPTMSRGPQTNMMSNTPIAQNPLPSTPFGNSYIPSPIPQGTVDHTSMATLPSKFDNNPAYWNLANNSNAGPNHLVWSPHNGTNAQTARQQQLGEPYARRSAAPDQPSSSPVRTRRRKASSKVIRGTGSGSSPQPSAVQSADGQKSTRASPYVEAMSLHNGMDSQLLEQAIASPQVPITSLEPVDSYVAAIAEETPQQQIDPTVESANDFEALFPGLPHLEEFYLDPPEPAATLISEPAPLSKEGAANDEDLMTWINDTALDTANETIQEESESQRQSDPAAVATEAPLLKETGPQQPSDAAIITEVVVQKETEQQELSDSEQSNDSSQSTTESSPAPSSASSHSSAPALEDDTQKSSGNWEEFEAEFEEIMACEAQNSPATASAMAEEEEEEEDEEDDEEEEPEEHVVYKQAPAKLEWDEECSEEE
ncbi:hypothetical protein B0J14DRAFT_648597 [Halenospora varia]|nr:hypothetical protein B0J14DRAFT_648597 [Halenospora varia]